MATIKDVNWEVIQGDTWSVEIDVTDSLNAPINWTGYTFYMEVRDKDGGSILCATAALNDGITVAYANISNATKLYSENDIKTNLFQQ